MTDNNDGTGGKSGPISLAERRDPLRKQLEQARFERAMEVTESLADKRGLLTTAELARINNIITGRNDEPWRTESTNVRLPGGRSAEVALYTDPVLNTREKLHRATDIAEKGNPVEAALHVYTNLVLSHFFRDANRRTAALAAHYFFRRYDVPLSGLALHELGLGDIRQPGQMELLRETVQQMIKFGERRRE